VSDISFDPSKNERNVASRGISFEVAEQFEWDTAMIAEDLRKEYGDMKRKPRATTTTRENPEWTDATFERARPARDTLPELVGEVAATRLLKPRGRPKSDSARLAISLRLPPDTLARWKATGPGWQTRMAEVLSRAVGCRST
jgi:uncharacterized protein (DUF4415 family)